MFSPEIRYVTSTACLIILGHLAGFVAPHCCPSFASSCPLTFPATLFHCCSYGSCDIFCCNCDAECRVKGCHYELLNQNFTVATYRAESVSQSKVCSSSDDCSLTVNSVFAQSVLGNVTLSAPVLSLISEAFASEFGDAVAERTATGLTFTCNIQSGNTGWLSQEPKFAILSGVFIKKCCNGDECEVILKDEFSFRKPLVNSSGINAGRLFCESSSDKSGFFMVLLLIVGAIVVYRQEKGGSRQPHRVAYWKNYRAKNPKKQKLVNRYRGILQNIK